MKKYLLIGMIFILVGCSNEIEEQKTVYTELKKELFIQENFTNIEDIPFNITTTVQRKTEEQIQYEVMIDHPEEEMHQVKVLVLHNYFTDEIFPSVGIFEEAPDLIPDEEDTLILTGNIDTTKDIMNLNLMIKIYIEYEDENQEIHQIYYQSTKYE